MSTCRNEGLLNQFKKNSYEQNCLESRGSWSSWCACTKRLNKYRRTLCKFRLPEFCLNLLSVKVHLAGSILLHCCHHCLRCLMRMSTGHCPAWQQELPWVGDLAWLGDLDTGEDWHSPLCRGHVGRGEASARRPGDWRGLTLTSVSVTRGSLLRVFWVARTSTVADSGQGQDRGL